MDKDVLAVIRKNVDSYVGQKVKLRANRGRRKDLEKEGILEKAHSNVFVISVHNTQYKHHLSYSYADLLTDDVKLVTLKDNQRIGVI